ncbi:hypothetical protein ES708_07989 [subsurface metagenome]
MTELEGLILYWKSLFLATRFLLNPSVETHIENTIKYLEELQKIKGGA